MCRPICWVIAAIVGILVGVFSGLSTLWAIVVAILVFVFLGWALTRWVCGGDEISAAAAPAPMAAPKPTQTAAPTPAPTAAPSAAAETAPEPAPAPAPEPAATPEAAPAPAPSAGGAAHWSAAVAADSGKAGSGRGQSDLKPSAELAEEATLRDGVGSWKYESDAAPYRPEGASPAAIEAPEPAQATASEPASAAATPEVAESAPEILTAARGGAADDLKRIKGVGPGLEKTLNEMGFYHFDQIAAWGPAEVAWVDARLKFKGRIERDSWIAQAAELAKG